MRRRKRKLGSPTGGLRPNDAKLKELILYVAKQSESDQDFGKTKLNKILFYSDFIAYGRTGGSITGHEYQKLANGPAPRRFLPILEEMQKSGDCSEQERKYFGYTQKRVVALREPDLSNFSGEEVAIVEDVLRMLRGVSASDISKVSHEFVGWQAFDIGDVIPYSTVFVSSRELTEEEKDYARQLEATCAT